MKNGLLANFGALDLVGLLAYCRLARLDRVATMQLARWLRLGFFATLARFAALGF
jgi:hypothetical protein